MNNPELVVTIITTVLTIVSALLGFLATKNEKVKRYYKRYVEIEKLVKELCVIAEANYKNGDQKKKYVISSINTFLTENNIEFDIGLIEDMIESI
ncbi:TPA: hypothetical protein GXZ34_00710, partial [bacterium]|nr:hypothetical protein [bacterium]